MDTTKIKAFLMIEKYKNFSKVAEEFSYTPSAVSHMADALETELGIKLFKRTRKGVDLTGEGRQLYAKFADVIKAENSLKQAASELSKTKEMSLKIGAFSSIAWHLLPEILRDFKNENPLVKTTIMVDDYMQNWVETGVADVIFTDAPGNEKNWHPIMADEYVAVVPETEFLQAEEISVQKLYEFTFIRPDEAVLETYFDYLLFKEVIPVKSIENSSAVFMVKENLGVTVLPRLSISFLPPGVKTLKLNPPLQRTIGIEYESDRLTAAGRLFVKHIEKYNNKENKLRVENGVIC